MDTDQGVVKLGVRLGGGGKMRGRFRNEDSCSSVNNFEKCGDYFLGVLLVGIDVTHGLSLRKKTGTCVTSA